MNHRQGTEVLKNSRALPSPGLVEVRSVVERIVTVQESIQGVLAGLTKLAAGTDEQVQRLAARVDELCRMQKCIAESQQQSDEKLNALIAVVDDLVRERKGC
jgi:uncharacterized protein YoxC